MAEAPSRSFAENAYALLAQHAPFATISAILGMALVPDGYVGAYAINAVVVAAFLVGIARIVWELPTALLLADLLGIACVPVLFQTVAEARPDLPWGLALGLAIAGIIRRPLLGRSRSSLSILGVLVGLAVLVKPTALPASLACAVAAVAIALARDCLSDPTSNVRRALRQSATCAFFLGLGLVATITPYVAVRHEHLFRYIYAVLVLDQDFWRYDADFYQQAVFYSVGGGGELALGIFLWIGLVLFLARLA
jgi:hypothetical protein